MADSRVSCNPEFWEGAEKLVNWCDHHIHKKGDRSECTNYWSECTNYRSECTNYRVFSLLCLPGKAYAKCLGKGWREIIKLKQDDA